MGHRIRSLQHIVHLEKCEKGKMLADFLVEIQSFESLERENMVLSEKGMAWIMNTEGASNRHGAGISIIL